MMKIIIEVHILIRPTMAQIFKAGSINISLTKKKHEQNNSHNSILNNSCCMHNCRKMNNKRKYFEPKLSS